MYCCINPVLIASERTILGGQVSTPLHTMLLLPLRKAQFISVRETCRARKRLPVHAAFAADISERARLRRASGRRGAGGEGLAQRPIRARPIPGPAAAPKNTAAGERNTQKPRRNRPAYTQKHLRNRARSANLRVNVSMLADTPKAKSKPFALSEAEPHPFALSLSKCFGTPLVRGRTGDTEPWA